MFIHTGRKGGQDVLWCEEVVTRPLEWVVPHALTVDKNWEGQLGSK